MNKSVKPLGMFALVALLLIATGCDNGATLTGPDSLEGLESGYTIVMQGEYPVKVPLNFMERGANLAPIAPRTASSDACMVESYDAVRTSSLWGLTESYLSDTRGYLLDTANFGAGGVVSEPISVGPGINVASAAALDGVDVFFTGWVSTGTYSAAEKQALKDFVLDGGVVIGTTDDLGHNMADVFDVTHGGGAPGANTVTDTAHPMADGPFGTVTNYTQYFAIGYYSDLGPYALELGANASGTSIAYIPENGIAAGSGRVILVADVDVFSDFAGSTANETLIKNIFAYACDEPVIDVTIDIKPGSFPNSINTKSMGVVPVAILGSADFDVTVVDASSLQFGPAGASPAHTPAGHLEDVNGDGYTDLVTHYVQKDTGLALGDTEACITGFTTDGVPLQGCDSVNIVN